MDAHTLADRAEALFYARMADQTAHVCVRIIQADHTEYSCSRSYVERDGDTLTVRSIDDDILMRTFAPHQWLEAHLVDAVWHRFEFTEADRALGEE